MNDDKAVTRNEVELLVQLGNEKVKGDIMERVIHNEGAINSNTDDVCEIKGDIKTIMNLLRNKDRFTIATMVSSFVTLLTIAVTIILVLI